MPHVSPLLRDVGEPNVVGSGNCTLKSGRAKRKNKATAQAVS